ncbi:hypothetical protein FACS189454_00300 [Planctomycetales bacterium]|nr:hypothetical protein FACS189454_00300 [Planctomycetales bacterium]
MQGSQGSQAGSHGWHSETSLHGVQCNEVSFALRFKKNPLNGRRTPLQPSSQTASHGSQATGSHGWHSETSLHGVQCEAESLALRLTKNPPKGRKGAWQGSQTTSPHGSQAGSHGWQAAGSHGSQAAGSHGWQAVGSHGLQTTDSRPKRPASALVAATNMAVATNKESKT